MQKDEKNFFNFFDTDLGLNTGNDWVEENVFFETKVEKQNPIPLSRSYIGIQFNKLKKTFLLSIICLVLVIFFIRLGNLQFTHGDDYRKRAESHRQRIVPIVSERGLIFDRYDKQLVNNIPSLSLALVPQQIPNNPEIREKVVSKLSNILQIEEDKLRETLLNYSNYNFESLIIKENLDYESALSILIAAADLPGVRIEKGSTRLYRSGNSSPGLALSHVLGYLGKLNQTELNNLRSKGYITSDWIGKAGLEKVYENELRGIYGKELVEINAYGKEQSTSEEQAPVPGNHLKLSIDVEASDELERILQKQLIKLNKNKAAAVALNPQNGEVIALVSLPSYNNNDFSGGISKEKYSDYINNQNKPLFNRAIGGTYPSGSSVKPAIAAAALQEGIITEKTKILSVGGLQVGPWFFPDWLAGGHGLTDVRKSIAWSVNTFYYYIGGGYREFQGLGVEKIKNYLEKFGLSKKLGIDLPNETDGFIPSKDWKKQVKGEGWFVGDTYNLSIGQGDLLVTPLQIASLTGALANNGVLYKPRIVQSIINPISKEIINTSSTVLSSGFISEKNINIVKNGMRDCVLTGSCHRLSYLPIDAAGKTGTAQWNSNKENQAWFTSFAPFNKPKIVVTVLIEEGGEGGIVSQPVAYEFYSWLVKNRFAEYFK